MQHKIVTVSSIFIHDLFRPYTAIIRCLRYAKLFTALLVSILKLKLKLRFKFELKQDALLNKEIYAKVIYINATGC
jgi:hypothetical protein